MYVCISFPNEPWVDATANQQQTHPKVMTKMAKKCSTDQRFIRKRNTTYKIHTLVDLKIPPDPNDPLV